MGASCTLQLLACRDHMQPELLHHMQTHTTDAHCSRTVRTQPHHASASHDHATPQVLFTSNGLVMLLQEVFDSSSNEWVCAPTYMRPCTQARQLPQGEQHVCPLQPWV